MWIHVNFVLSLNNTNLRRCADYYNYYMYPQSAPDFTYQHTIVHARQLITAIEQALAIPLK